MLGAFLTALVARYVLPCGWSFYLSLTVGSILGETDPVAVVSLLKNVGAQPRLRMLIAGESMLNDGVAIVLFIIFKGLYFFESTGGMQEVLGGAALGIVWGVLLIFCLQKLDRRYDRGDATLQVTISITVYWSYYISSELAHTPQ